MNDGTYAHRARRGCVLLSDRIDKFDIGVMQVATAADQQAASAEEISMMVDQTAENAEEVHNKARELDAAVRDQSSAILNASEHVDTITDITEDEAENG